MRNIYLSYFITICQHTWFWTGIWVLYYLKFTDYAGIGLIETAMIISATAFEIPTGALADIIGRKKIIIIALLLGAVGNILMGFAQSFIFLVIATIIPSRAFYSGAIESLTYDSLLQEGKENTFNKVISNINSLMLLSIAVSSILGGLLYKFNPRYPFILCGIFDLLGVIFCIFLTEPKVIRESKLNIKEYLTKIKEGSKHLFIQVDFRRLILFFITFGSFLVITEEVLDYSLAVQFGFKEVELGLLFAVAYLVSSLASQLSKISQKISPLVSIFIMIVLFVFSLLVSPISGIILGGVLIVLRNAIIPIFNNLAYVEINKHISSEYRTTALSSFSMINKLPYVLAAFLIGKFTDISSAALVAVVLGVILLVLIVPQALFLAKNQKTIF